MRRLSVGHSISNDILQSSDGGHVGDPDQDPGSVAPNAQMDGVVNVDLAAGLAVAKIVEIGVAKFQEDLVESGQSAEANVG